MRKRTVHEKRLDDDVDRLRARVVNLQQKNKLLRVEVAKARNLLHESGKWRNVNHVLCASTQIAEKAYRDARAATDAGGAMMGVES